MEKGKSELFEWVDLDEMELELMCSCAGGDDNPHSS